MDFSNKNVAFYIRGRTIRTIAKQQGAINRFAKTHNISQERMEFFVDHCDSDEVRPELFRLIENAERFDAVVMYSYHPLHIDFEKYKLLENSLTVNGLEISLIHS
ncbi:hypothetical protein HN020_14865 [Brevibacillus borstelensis]|uniref:hypothetical protein n=1 Tax=Brevibacillus borstelensis TaxID=45462 RepID=UPI0004684451|nr:hypothetical protein [Brevibacillus borstelensis]MCC0567420.1 hypothetical protein [Brevibacillus borstelensis]MCM3561557.1 hypothetical protein [Brevibacillus borstelensis]MCM3593968.1 hypothetical protein [Brevibacillus borstelensis]NOU56025.1 hypothetical protein [Brevibacillus borstelensis]